MGLPKSWVKLSQVAEKWKRTESDLVYWIIEGRMRAFYWYGGHYVFQSALSSKKNRSGYHSPNWVVLSSTELEPLQANPNVKVKWLTPVNSQLYPPHICPAAEYGQEKILKPIDVVISFDDIYLHPEEVDQMERANPELAAQTEQFVGCEKIHSGASNGNLDDTAESSLKVKHSAEEKELRGLGEIAKYWDRSVSSVKNYKKLYPSYFDKEGGTIVTLPSKIDELRALLKSKPKKK